MMKTAGANLAASAAFRAARDFLLQTGDPVAAHAGFRWPELHQFNWARDWFDVVAAEHGDRCALVVCAPDGDVEADFASLARRSDQLAAWMQQQGMQRGERVLVLMRNSIALYEVLLAGIKLGLVLIPSYVTISAAECADRVQRGGIKHLIAEAALLERLAQLPPLHCRIVAQGTAPGWLSLDDSRHAPFTYDPGEPTLAHDLLFGYFTSGTTSLPKLALHTHTSYPVGHLSGMYWNGVTPGSVHLNVSNPGWAKHAWSSFFVPWNAQSTIVVLDAAEIRPQFILDVLQRRAVNSCCAPTTVWRMLQQHGMGARPAALRQLNSAGEPLQPVLFDAIKQAWGLEVRDGYGQSEATCLVGNAPGLPIKIGAMGLPMPGYQVVLLDQSGALVAGEGEGEVCLDLRQGKPCGLMHGYDEQTTNKRGVVDGAFYHTGDFAKRDADGYITFIGRIDDVFKSFDYRISPFELERVMLAHPAIVELAIVPSPDPLGLVVPKAFICTHPDWYPGEETALDIARWMCEHLPPEFRIRRICFVETLPKTASGKVRRAELRDKEGKRGLPIAALDDEYLVDELLAQN
ncbi:AMP-binding protein [Massilia sp. W12]|uniref:AMP-binding protein n=1 Tax=Massilia sp. W12 TaxID=3126507 RepID=UPI0030D5BBC7